MNSGPTDDRRLAQKFIKIGKMLNFLEQSWYLFSSSVHNHKIALGSSKIREICFDSFLCTAGKFGYILAGFVLMPSHVHLQVGVLKKNEIPVSQIIKNFKGAASRRVLAEFPELKLDLKSRHFWTDGYHCALLSNSKSFSNSLQYVINNPAKSKLDDWAYSLFVDEEYLLSGRQFIGGNVSGDVGDRDVCSE